MDDKALRPWVCLHPGTFECTLAQIMMAFVFTPIALVLDLFGYDLQVEMIPKP